MADWREGEAILWAGTNLAQKAEPEIVEITKSVTNDGGISYDAATNVNSTTISANAFKSSVGNRQMKLTIKVKTGSTGANIECENLTAALGTIDNQSSPELTYDDDGNLYQKWTVSLNASAAKNAKDNSTPLVFRVYNQLDSEKHITLQLNPGIDPDDLQYGDIIYDDCTIVHLGESKPVDKTAVGVVVFKSDTPTTVCEAGVTNDEGETVIGKALVVALKPCLKDGVNYAKWSGESSSQNYDENNSLFPNISGNHATARADLKGYEKTKYLVGGCNGMGHTHPAAVMASTYHEQQLNMARTDYLACSTGWFLPSIGQWMYLMESCYQNGDMEGNRKHNDTLTWPWEQWYNNDHGPNFMSLLVSWAGGEYIGNHHWMSSEYDADQVHQPCHTSSSMAGSWWGQGGNYGGFGQGGYKSANNYVRAVLAY